MITKRTKIYSGVSIVLFTSAVVLIVFMVQSINSKGQQLLAQTQELANYSARQQSYRDLETLINETSSDRSELLRYVLTEDKTIQFLSDIEKIASKKDISFTTNSLTVSPQDGLFDILEIEFAVEGREESVYELVRTLESLPYHASIDSISFQKTIDKNGISMIAGIIKLTVSLLKT